MYVHMYQLRFLLLVLQSIVVCSFAKIELGFSLMPPAKINLQFKHRHTYTGTQSH